jgi:hypothetical protein
VTQMTNSKNLTIEESFKMFGDIYDEIAIEMSEKIPGYVAVGVEIVEFQKLLWKNYRINKKEFATVLQMLRDYDREVLKYYSLRVKLYGGPTSHYHKNNYVECDGRHYILIEVETEDHMKRMAPHRG